MVTSIASAQDLSSDASLPPGMTREQMLELMQKKSASTNSQQVAKSDTSRFAREGYRGLSTDEGELLIDTAGTSGRTWSRDSVKPAGQKTDSARKPRRFVQDIFRNAEPSMFASHVGAVGSNYQLGAGDEIVLTLWGQKEARYNLVLDRDGQVVVEGVGVISLNGQNLTSATDLLRKRLQRIYSGLGSGGVNMDVTMGKLKQVRIFVVGEVVRSGGYLLSGNTSIFGALYQAKGPSDLGSERTILVTRGSKELSFDLYDYVFYGKKPAGDVLQDGDVVRVPRRGVLVDVRGDVGRPGLYELKEKEGAKELIGFAGGLNATTANTPISVLRVFENGRVDAVKLPAPQEVLAGAAAPIKDGDIVQIFPGKDPTSSTVSAAGLVRFPGAFPFTEGMTAADLLGLGGGLSRDAYPDRILLSRRLESGLREQSRFSVGNASSVVLKALDSITVFDRREMAFRDSVRISGAVQRPGVYVWQQGMTIKDLILKAGGFKLDAEFGNVRVESPIVGARKSKVEYLPLDSSLSTKSADQPLLPQSHIEVPFNPSLTRLEMVEVRGWIERPGSYGLRESGERFSSLFERVGGLRPDAYLEGARLIRGDSLSGRIQIDFKKALSEKGGYDDLPLRGGDIIVIPMRPATVSVKGRVNSPRNIVWREGKSWKWYIQQAGGYSDSADEDRVYVRFADGSVETRDGGISDKPNPGSEVIVPFRKPPEPTTFGNVLTGLNTLLATVMTGLGIFLLLQKN
jgi:polysaccharide export outer membrane protein